MKKPKVTTGVPICSYCNPTIPKDFTNPEDNFFTKIAEEGFVVYCKKCGRAVLIEQ